MKRFLTLLLLFLLALPGLARAEAISLKRGLPTDIWLTWPEADRLSEPGLIKTFPEYRQSYKGGEFKLVKQAGFDFVRLTIDPAIYLGSRVLRRLLNSMPVCCRPFPKSAARASR